MGKCVAIENASSRYILRVANLLVRSRKREGGEEERGDPNRTESPKKQGFLCSLFSDVFPVPRTVPDTRVEARLSSE